MFTSLSTSSFGLNQLNSSVIPISLSRIETDGRLSGTKVASPNKISNQVGSFDLSSVTDLSKSQATPYRVSNIKPSIPIYPLVIEDGKQSGPSLNDPIAIPRTNIVPITSPPLSLPPTSTPSYLPLYLDSSPIKSEKSPPSEPVTTEETKLILPITISPPKYTEEKSTNGTTGLSTGGSGSIGMKMVFRELPNISRAVSSIGTNGLVDIIEGDQDMYKTRSITERMLKLIKDHALILEMVQEWRGKLFNLWKNELLKDRMESVKDRIYYLMEQFALWINYWTTQQYLHEIGPEKIGKTLLDTILDNLLGLIKIATSQNIMTSSRIEWLKLGYRKLRNEVESFSHESAEVSFIETTPEQIGMIESFAEKITRVFEIFSSTRTGNPISIDQIITSGIIIGEICRELIPVHQHLSLLIKQVAIRYSQNPSVTRIFESDLTGYKNRMICGYHLTNTCRNNPDQCSFSHKYTGLIFDPNDPLTMKEIPVGEILTSQSSSSPDTDYSLGSLISPDKSEQSKATRNLDTILANVLSNQSSHVPVKSEEDSNLSTTISNGRSEKTRAICRHWSSKGTCWHGDKCKFEHPDLSMINFSHS